MADERLIVALDFSELDQVKNLVEKLGISVSYYKVGMELFYSVGSQVIEYLRNKDKKIFLDLKLYDIPNTVAKSAATLTRLGVSMLNVHASGGEKMMAAAAEAVAEQSHKLGIPRPKLIAVTVLTSFNEIEWSSLSCKNSIAKQVIHLTNVAHKAGIDGVVASPLEASAISAEFGKQFLVVTPGVRPNGTSNNDQNRVLTPYQALKSGSTHLVVGRPITAAIDPRTAAEAILNEMRTI